MSNSIYNIPTWTAGSSTYYKKHDIVRYGGYFYYALQNHTSSTIGTGPAGTLGNWSKMAASPFDGSTKYEFIWKPSYQGRSNHTPSVRKIQFDDGYAQTIPSNIYTDLLSFELSFNNRSIDESTAITHFLSNHKGATSFVWVPMSPYASAKLFKCSEWQVTQNFLDNISISATFKESNN